MAGYTYHGDAPITGLTRFELDKLQLGWIVRQEQKHGSGGNPPHAGTRMSQARKREHKNAIRQRLKRN